MSMRVLRGIAALIAIVILVAGIPAGLWAVAGSPVPGVLPEVTNVVHRLLRPDVTGAVALTVIKYAGWLAWATFTVAVLVEVPARVRGVPAPRIRGLQVQQKAAGALVAAVIAMLVVGPVMAAPSAHAVALETPATTVSAAAVSAAASPAVAPTVGQAASAADDQAPTTFTYVVRPGDSLWRIAEKYLGSGDRFPEIARLNYGAPQPGGHALDTSHWIDPGWTLRIPGVDPGAAATPQASATGATAYVVQPGDTLWDLAQQHLGDGHRFGEILEASRAITQPDGAHLSDPRGLQPGWTVNIPAATAAAVAAAPAEAALAAAAVEQAAAPTSPAPAAPATSPDAVATHADDADAPAHHAASGVARTAAETADAPDSAEHRAVADVSDVASVGVGAAAAVGLLALLVARRRRRERDRAPGERVALPAPGSPPAVLEAELREAADPVGIDHLDAALRALGGWHAQHGLSLPVVRAARMLPGGIELYLDAPARLPAPWQGAADELVWELSRDAVAELGAAEPGPAPFPALVTLGRDDEGAYLLVDLEHVGLLSLTGPADAATAAASGLAVELAAGPWADDLQVTCVGLRDDLEGVLDTGRVHHAGTLADVLTAAEHRAEAAARQLETLGCSGLREARGRTSGAGMFNPEVLVIGHEPSASDHERLARLARRGHAVAVVVAAPRAADGWALELGPLSARRARLLPMGVDLVPQLLDEATYQALIALLDPATIALVPGPSWAQGLVHHDEPELDDLTRVRAVPTAGGTLAGGTFTGGTSTGGTFTGGTSTGRTFTPGIDDDPALGALEDTTVAGPLVRVLGPVAVDRARGDLPATAHLARSLELSAYLVLHPEGAGVAEIAAAMWPRRGTGMRSRVPAAISRVRRWWGVSPDGREHVAVARDARRDVEVYRAAGVGSDWERFTALVGPDAARTPTARLSAALDLVSGPPLAAERPFGWAGPVEAELRAAVLDVAREVAARGFDDGRPDLAGAAAAAARLVDPGDERAWRDGLRAAWAGGDHAEVRELASAYYSGAPGRHHEPDPDTEDLIDQLIGRVAA